LWGGATSAFQIEGNLTAGNRAPSIWDTFVKNPDRVGYADLACNSYYQYKDDIKVLKDMGATAYRLSLSWPRIIQFQSPGGPHKTLNPAGVEYYKNVLTECRRNNITPIVTLYHWDLPQALQDLYGGWLCTKRYGADGSLQDMDPKDPNQDLAIVADFAAYAEACFRAFGDLVDYWATINEPQTIAVDCYEFDWYAPGAGTPDGNCPSGIDYRAAHNLLLAHAGAYAAFQKVFAILPPAPDTNMLSRVPQSAGGTKFIGLACNMDWGEPLDPRSPADVAAAERGNVFWGGWFWDPLFYGKYPQEMVQRAGARLPTFTTEQSRALRGSFNILYWNTYSTSYVTPSTSTSTSTPPMVGWTYDQDTAMTPIGGDGKVIGTAGQSSWLHMVPWGAAKCLQWIQNRYSRPEGPSAAGKGVPGRGILGGIPVVVTENGFDIVSQGIDTSVTTAVQDCERVTYLHGYLRAIKDAAAQCGVYFKGYTPWSLLDNYEWTHGFTARFGMTYVDFTDAKGNLLKAGGAGVRLPRTPKSSALVLADIVREVGL
jgi:beta-glucosidase